MKFAWLVLCLAALGAASEWNEDERQGRNLNPNFWNQFVTSFDRLGEHISSALDSVLGGSEHAPVKAPTVSQSRSPAQAPTRNRPTGFNPFDLGSPVVSPFLNLFDNFRSRNWWEGPNICIERSERDDTLNQTVRTVEPADSVSIIQIGDNIAQFGDVKNSDDIGSDILDLDDSDEVETSGTRQSRQFQSHIRMSSCKETASTYVCTTSVRSNGVRKTFQTKYSCCYGTIRSPGGNGCTPVEVKPLSEVLVSSGARSFATYMESSAGIERISKGNYTFFVPVDAASTPEATSVNDVLEDVQKPIKNANDDPFENEILRRRRDVQGQAMNPMSYIVPGTYRSDDLKDEMILKTEDPNANIRINEYAIPQYLLTANCKRIVKIDQYTTEGVVHLLEGEMQPATKSLAEILKNDPKYSTFYTLVEKAGLLDLLGKPGQITLLAPTNEAFDNLPALEREKILNGKGCVDGILRQHLLPHVICSTAVTSRARTRTMASSHVLLERSVDGSLKVDGNKIGKTDVIGTNGVLHEVDGVLIPENAKTVVQILEERGFTEFLKLLDSAVDSDGRSIDLRSYFNQLDNFTFFAPNNPAVLRFVDNPANKDIVNSKKLQDVIQHHIVDPQVVSLKMKNDQVLHAAKGRGLRTNTYSFGASLIPIAELNTRSTVQCAPIVRSDIPVCGGVMHIVESVLSSPAESVWDIIKTNGSFSILKKLIEGAELADDLEKPDGLYTLLAPSDQAFYQLPEETLSEMLKDPKKAAPILKQHILPEHLCCAGVQRGGFLLPTRKQTLDGTSITIQRLFDGVVAAGDARVLKCDIVAGNGVVHMIDKVILPQATRIGPLPMLFGGNKRLALPGLELVLFG